MSCKYCSGSDNDFVILNETSEYSGVEMSLNRQGMLRARYYGDNDIWFSQEIVNIKFCPICGAKMDGGKSNEE